MNMHRLTRLMLLVLLVGAAAAERGEAADMPVVAGMTISELDRLIAAEKKRMVLVVMAAWCQPCIRELPDLVQLNRKYRPKGLRMIGISLDAEGPSALAPILRQEKVNFPVYWVGEEAIVRYGVFGIPMLLLVKKGRIVDRIVGKRSREFLDEAIGDFLME